MTRLKDLIDAYSNCISTNQNVIRQLKAQIKKIDSFKESCSIAKTVGTSVNIIGGIGMLAAPFTGGLSLVLTISGAVASASGVATNLVTDWLKSSETEKFTKTIQKYNESRKEKLEKLGKLQQEFQKDVQSFQKAGSSEEEAQTKAMLLISGMKIKPVPKNRTKSTPRVTPNKRTGFRSSTQVEKKTPRYHRPLKSFIAIAVIVALAAIILTLFPTANASIAIGEVVRAMNMLEDGLRAAEVARAIRTAELAAKAASAMKATEVGVRTAQAANSISTTAQVGVAAANIAKTTKDAGSAVFRVFGMVATTTLIVVDVALLIKEWSSTNLASKYATDVITQLESEENNFRIARQHLVDFQTSLADRTDLEVATMTQIDEYNKLESPSSSSDEECTCVDEYISVFYVNIQSMRPPCSNLQKQRIISNYIAREKPNIIVFLETWLLPISKNEDLKNEWNLRDYDLFRYDRQECGSSVEADRNRGGGTLVCWNTVKGSRFNYYFEEDSKVYDSDALRFFCITKHFNCRNEECRKVDIQQSTLSLKTYTFATVYRRGAPFQTSSTLQKEDRKDYNDTNAGFVTLFQDYFREGFGDFFRHSRAAGVLVGDLNWDESEWNKYVGEIKSWTRIPTGPTYFLNSTSPDGVLSAPRQFVCQPVNTMECGIPHKALVFKLRLGKDFSDNNPCEKCSDVGNMLNFM